MKILLNSFLIFLLFFSILIAKGICSLEDNPESNLRIYHYYIVTATAYSPSPEETDDTSNITALLQKPIPGWTCAVSWDLRKYLGKKVYISGYGVRRVNDLMNKRYKKRIDLCMGKNDAIEFGIKRDVLIVFF